MARDDGESFEPLRPRPVSMPFHAVAPYWVGCAAVPVRPHRDITIELVAGVGLSAAIFALDASGAAGGAVPVLYMVVMSLCLRLPWRWAIPVCTGLASVLTVAGHLLSVGWAAPWPGLADRILALAVLGGGALLLVRLRSATAALGLARDHAEAAARSKARFLSAASHDLRHPIQAGMLFHDLLVRRLRGSCHTELIDSLGQSFILLRAMVDGLLEVSRLDSAGAPPRAVPVSARAVFERLKAEFAPVAAAAGLRLRVVETRAVVCSDPDLLERMLQSLLANAIRFTVRGDVLLGCRRKGRSLHIQVWDTGVGIPADRLGDIFEEFQQLRMIAREADRGLGLGLAVVERLSRRLGHPVAVRSVVGRGSVFEVVVPLAGDERL